MIKRRSIPASVRAVLGARIPDAEDVLQTAFMRTLESLRQYKERGSLQGFACCNATRAAIDHLRKRFGRARDQRVEFLPLKDDGCEKTFEIEEEDQLNRITTGLFLHELSEEQSETLVLRLLLGYSVEDVSRLMNAPVNTIRSRLRRVRAALRERLGIEGNEGDEDGHEQ